MASPMPFNDTLWSCRSPALEIGADERSSSSFHCVPAPLDAAYRVSLFNFVADARPSSPKLRQSFYYRLPSEFLPSMGQNPTSHVLRSHAKG